MEIIVLLVAIGVIGALFALKSAFVALLGVFCGALVRRSLLTPPRREAVDALEREGRAPEQRRLSVGRR